MLTSAVAAMAQVAPTELDDLLSSAQNRLTVGKRLLQEGDQEGARRAFDRAVEILLSTPVTAPNRARVERRLEEIVDLIYRYDVERLGSGDATAIASFDKSPLDEIRELSFPLDPALKGLVQHQISATASQLPLETNDSVLSFINYFTTGRGRGTLINGWRRSHRYRPMIQRILAEEGVPQELIFLAQAESGFMPRAVSNKAASGMWQFVAFRGKEYGLEQTNLVDLRLDPERATRAAARHLKDLYMQFGDWHLAIAAYNCGPGCVDRAVQRIGSADYWELRRINAIPKETTNYVPIILALTIITKNAADYGIKLDDPDPAIEYDSLRVDAATNLDLVADAADIPVSGIRDLNPALLKSLAPAGFEVKVPRGSAAQVAAAIETVPPLQRASWRLHRVKQGEDLTAIAQRYRTTPKSIASANEGRSAETLAEGSVLMIPVSLTTVTTRTVTARVSRSPARAVAASGRKAPAKTLSKSLPNHPAVKSGTRKPTFPATGRRAAR
ncbi:MAG: transglycosylase SLT domain-containing protein [Acidobacteria bacterium]|nr:transglycosylase SLT domain-containing protein [Acidobacteriota bacterium]